MLFYYFYFSQPAFPDFNLALLCAAMSFPGQLAAGTCEIVTLDKDSSQPRRTIARQTARCACKKGQIAGTTRARPACVDGKKQRGRGGGGGRRGGAAEGASGGPERVGGWQLSALSSRSHSSGGTTPEACLTAFCAHGRAGGRNEV